MKTKKDILFLFSFFFFLFSFSDVAIIVSKCLLIVLYFTLKDSAANFKLGKLFIKSNVCELEAQTFFLLPNCKVFTLSNLLIYLSVCCLLSRHVPFIPSALLVSMK